MFNVKIKGNSIFGFSKERVIEALEFYLTGTCTAVQVWWKSAKLQKAVQQHERKWYIKTFLKQVIFFFYC
jgi:hypothetical protein